MPKDYNRYYAPTAIQMKSVVKGSDPSYRIRTKPLWPRYAALVFSLFVIVGGILFLIVEVVR